MKRIETLCINCGSQMFEERAWFEKGMCWACDFARRSRGLAAGEAILRAPLGCKIRIDRVDDQGVVVRSRFGVLVAVEEPMFQGLSGSLGFAVTVSSGGRNVVYDYSCPNFMIVEYFSTSKGRDGLYAYRLTPVNLPPAHEYRGMEGGWPRQRKEAKETK